MNAIPIPLSKLATSQRWQSNFLTILPAIHTHATHRFRHLPPEAREEATTEAIAAACVSYATLTRQKKLAQVYAGNIATFAVKGVIRLLAQKQRRLRPEEIHRRYGNVDEAARRYFGSWPKAILAAGIDPARILRVMPWSRERIIEAILTRVLHSKPLGRRSVSPPSLAEAAARIFGSWDAALTAAGLDPQAYVDPEPEVQTTPRRGRPRKVDAGMPTNNGQGLGDPAIANVKRMRKPPTPWSDQTVIEAIIASWLEQVPVISMRHYDKGRRLRAAGFTDWRESLLEMMVPDRRVSLMARLQWDAALENEGDRVARFCAQTGCSRPTYFRLKRQLPELALKPTETDRGTFHLHL